MTRGKFNDYSISDRFINRDFIQRFWNRRGKRQQTIAGKHDTNIHHVSINILGDGDMAMMIKTIKFTLHPSRVRKGETKSTEPIARSEYAQLYFDKGAGWNE